MFSALRVVWRGIGQFEHYGWLLVLANIVTVALSLPIVTAPVAFAALSHLSHTAQSTQTAVMNDYWEAFRQSFVRSSIIGASNVIALIMLITNFQVYALQSSVWFVALRIAWMLIFTAWLIVQLYLWPLMDEMVNPTLRGGLRNALVMFVFNPFFSLTLLVIITLLIIVSTLFAAPWLLLTFSLLVSITNAAVLDRLHHARERGQLRSA